MAFSVFKKNINRSLGGNLVILVLLLLVGAFLMLPLAYVVVTAFKPINEIYVFPPRLLTVKHPTTDNFANLSKAATEFYVPLSRYIFNSLFVSVVATLGHLLLSSMAAYPLSRHVFWGRKVINQMVVMALLFSASVTFIPQYIVMANFRLIDTYGALILPTLQATLGLYLMINFMSQIPVSILEAARIDGANEFTVMFKIVLPSVKPAWLTAAIFAFQGIWNSTGGSVVYRDSLKMLPSILSQLQASGLAQAGVTAAATLILMIPPIVLFLLSQNMVIETMSTSGMK